LASLQFSDMKFSLDSVHQKLLKLAHFRRTIQNIKMGHFSRHSVYYHNGLRLVTH